MLRGNPPEFTREPPSYVWEEEGGYYRTQYPEREAQVARVRSALIHYVIRTGDADTAHRVIDRTWRPRK